MTIIEQLEKRKKLLKVLNSPSSEEVYTPVALVEEMLDKLPLEIWKDRNLTWCDPCAKSGVFMLEVIIRLMKNISIKDETLRHNWIITNMVKAYINVERNKWIVSKMMYGSTDEVEKIKILDINNIKYKEMPKFDVVVGNPPYQHPTNKRWKLWVSFIELGLNITKPEGILSLITPIAWIDKSGKEIEKARKLLTEKTLMLVNINANKYFSVGEKIGYFMCFNKTSESNSLTKIFNDSKFIENKKLTLKANPIILTKDDGLKHAIISKIDNCVLPRIIGESYLSNIQDIGKILSVKKTGEFKYKIYHSASQTYYSSDKNVERYIYPKLIINFSGGYYSKTQPDKYMRVEIKEIAGRNATQIRTKNLITANNIKSFMSSNLYSFYVMNTKSSGFNTPMFKLPMLDENKLWADKEIYEYFNLTQEEIDYIESQVK